MTFRSVFREETAEYEWNRCEDRCTDEYFSAAENCEYTFTFLIMRPEFVFTSDMRSRFRIVNRVAWNILFTAF